MSNQPAEIAHYIHGRAMPGNSGRAQNVTNPATGAVTGTVALANVSEVNAAVQSAAAAFPAWSATPPLRRARIMFKFLALLNEHRDPGADDHPRARQGVHRCPGRSDPWHRSGRVRLRHPATAQG